MKPQGKRRICMLAGLLVLLATGCRPEAAGDAGSIAEAHRPDLVPLVRAMPTTSMDAPLTVEFDVDVPSRNSSPTLMIGIRVNRTDDVPALEALVDVQASGLQANVSMARLESGGWKDVPLLRLESIIGEPARTMLTYWRCRMLGWNDPVIPTHSWPSHGHAIPRRADTGLKCNCIRPCRSLSRSTRNCWLLTCAGPNKAASPPPAR